VTVTKNCTPDGGADASDRFQFTNKGNNTGDPVACEGSLVLTLERGAAFDIDEAAGNGTTDLANYTESRSTGCVNADGLQRGETGTCTITNTLKAAPKVTVNKVCPGGKASSGDRFQVKLDGSNAGESPLDCGGSLDVTVTAGAAYAITEGAAGTTDLANYTSSRSDDCSGTLANFGDTATCTITNTLKAAPKVTVTKACPNGKANSGDRFQVKRNGTNVGTPLDALPFSWKRSPAFAGPPGQDLVTVTLGAAFSVFVIVQLPASPKWAKVPEQPVPTELL